MESINNKLRVLPPVVSKCIWPTVPVSILPTRNLPSNMTTRVPEITTRSTISSSIKTLLVVLSPMLIAKDIHHIVKVAVELDWISKTSRMFWVAHFTRKLNQLAPVIWNKETRRWRMLTKMPNLKARAWQHSEASATRPPSFSTVKIISFRISHNSPHSMVKETSVAHQVMEV